MTEIIIRDALAYSKENDSIKLMADDEHFLSIWFGKQSTGHVLILRSGPWKLECSEKLSSEVVADLMHRYLLNDLSLLKTLQWTRPFDMVFFDNIQNLMTTSTDESF